MNKYSYELRPTTAQKLQSRDARRVEVTNNLYTTPRSRIESAMGTYRSGFVNESIQKQLACSVSENNLTLSLTNQQFLPQEAAKYFDIPSPNDSRYELNLDFPLRPSTSKLSSLTHRENERMKYKSHLITAQHKQIKSMDSPSSQLMNSPSEKDFYNIITKLGRVASQNNFLNKKLILKEGKLFESVLQENENQYLRVFVKDKKCPCHVEIKRISGNVRIFVSRTVAEPNEDMCDCRYTKDIFSISDPGTKFRCEYLHFCIHAVKDSNFSMLVKLGRNEFKSTDNLLVATKPDYSVEALKRDEALRVQFQKELDVVRLNKRKDTMGKSNKKDFIKLNALMSPRFSFRKDKSPEKTWEYRKNEAKLRKSIVIEQKKIQVMLSINRREIRLEKEKKHREQEIEQELRDRFYRYWVIFIYQAKTLTCIKHQIMLGRTQIFQKFKISSSAKRIQKLYRLSNKGLSIHHLALIHCLNNLSLLRLVTHRQAISASKSSIFKMLKESAIDSTLPNHFENFRSKGNFHSVISLQRSIRRFLARRRSVHRSRVNNWKPSEAVSSSPPKVKRKIKRRRTIKK
jgi:hypothetical protein